MSNLNENFTVAESKLCILATHPTEGLMYRGQTVWDNGETAIIAHHEPSTDGAEASKLLLIESNHRDNVVWFDELEAFKLACHQLKYCRCSRTESSIACPATDLPLFAGAYFDEDDLGNICYLDFNDDADLATLTRVPSISARVSSLCAHLGDDLYEALTLINVIRGCGDTEVHRLRRREQA